MTVLMVAPIVTLDLLLQIFLTNQVETVILENEIFDKPAGFHIIKLDRFVFKNDEEHHDFVEIYHLNVFDVVAEHWDSQLAVFVVIMLYLVSALLILFHNFDGQW